MESVGMLAIMLLTWLQQGKFEFLIANLSIESRAMYWIELNVLTVRPKSIMWYIGFTEVPVSKISQIWKYNCVIILYGYHYHWNMTLKPYWLIQRKNTLSAYFNWVRHSKFTLGTLAWELDSTIQQRWLVLGGMGLLVKENGIRRRELSLTVMVCKTGDLLKKMTVTGYPCPTVCPS